MRTIIVSLKRLQNNYNRLSINPEIENARNSENPIHSECFTKKNSLNLLLLNYLMR